MQVPILSILKRAKQRDRITARFWAMVDRSAGKDACWPWTGSRHRSGYGRFKMVSYHTVRAHRFSYAIHNDDDPGEMLVCHSCDFPPCCNPKHLFKGTVQDNSTDMVRKGRWRGRDQTGSRNGSAKLTEAEVEEIRELIARKWTNTAIGAKYGVHHATISAIRRGRIWTHVGTKVGTGTGG